MSYRNPRRMRRIWSWLRKPDTREGHRLLELLEPRVLLCSTLHDGPEPLAASDLSGNSDLTTDMPAFPYNLGDNYVVDLDGLQQILHIDALPPLDLIGGDPFQNTEAGEQADGGGGGGGSGPAGAPLADTFKLHSVPGALHTIYLDFDGHVTQGTHWNSGGNSITHPAYDPDGNGAAFTDNELGMIQRAWQRVAEDYAPFNVNVTTEDPGEEALKKSGAGDTAWGIRVVTTRDTWANCGCGGFAYIGSFNFSDGSPVFVFNTQDYHVAAAASHEVGHAVYLSHDGTSNPYTGYYNGHGSGDTGWGPIMGTGYYQNLTTWDDGTYYNSNNGGSYANYGYGRDDLAVITTNNGFGFRTDDHGGTSGAASPITVLGTNAGNSSLYDVQGFGVVSQRTDQDYFSFTTQKGQVNLTLNSYYSRTYTSDGAGGYTQMYEPTPSYQGNNLDVLATIYNSSGQVVATSNPMTGLSATFPTLNLNAGTYYVSVDGTGVFDPLNNPPSGYSDFGSLGQYYISGTIRKTNAPGNLAPNANEDTVSTLKNTAITIGVRTNDNDQDGGTLDVTGVTQPTSGGSVVLNADDTILFTPTTNFTGYSTFTYTLSDGQGGTDTGTAYVWVVPPVNRPPVANDDSATTPVNTPVTINVLANDSDPDGNPITVYSVGYGSRGYAVRNADNTVTYTPYQFQWGTDSFSYTITDGQGSFDTAVVTVTIPEPENWPPFAVDDYAWTAPGVPISIDVMANDFDLDGDPFTMVDFTQPTEYSNLPPITIVDIGISSPTHGTVRLDPLDHDKLLYSPDPLLAYGYAWFTYTIRDNQGGQSTGTVWVDVGQFTIQPQPFPNPGPIQIPFPDPTVKNSPPRAENDTAETEVNYPVTVNVRANDYDPNYDLFFVNRFTQPSNGTVVLNTDETFTYTPNEWFSGYDSFSYTITDVWGGSDTAFVTINVYEPESYPPIARDDTAQTEQYQPVTLYVLSNDSDPAGDPLTIFAVTEPINGGTVEVVSGNRIVFTPAWGYSGTDNFAYSIGDGNERYDMASVEVVIQPTIREIIIEPPPINPPPIVKVNAPPIAAPDTAFYNGTTPVNIDVLRNDIDVEGTTLTVTGVTQPANGTVSINPDQTVRYKANSGFGGVDNFTYTIKDATGRTGSGQVLVAPNQTGAISCGICNELPPLPEPPPEGSPEEGDGGGETDSADGVILSMDSLIGVEQSIVIDGVELKFHFDPLELPDLLPDSGSEPGAEGGAPESGSGGAEGAGGPAGVPLANTFKLHSVPNATKTIYLDFDGHVTEGTAWNNSNRPTMNSPAWDPENNGPAFSDTELARIQRAWQRAAEDFAPFDVNVTTEDPGVEALRKSGTGDTTWGVRAIVTRDNYGLCGCGGIAYIGSFNWSTDTGVFVFNSGETSLGDTISHEVGHSVYLSHDGLVGGTEYYSGHGTGEPDWAPVMGVGFSANMTTWDDGTYFNSNNGTSSANYGKGPLDLTVMTTYNGFGFRSDDFGNGTGAASTMTITGTNPGNSNLWDVADFGVITTPTDLDFFQFDTQTGTVNLTINAYYGRSYMSDGAGGFTLTYEATPSTQGTNEDILATIYNSSGQVIATSNPTGMSASFTSLTLNAGTYYLSVDGTGFGTPTASPPTGYNDYGSLGQYYITGTIQKNGVTGNLAPNAVEDNAWTLKNTVITLNVKSNDFDPNGDAITVTAVGQPTTGTGTTVLNADGTVRYTPASNYTGSTSFTYTISDGNGGTDVGNVYVTVRQPVNNPPNANNDSATTTVNTPVTINVLANDSDPDGNPISVSSVGYGSLGYAYKNADNTVTYTPYQYSYGTDTFSYTISDGLGGTDSAIVTVTIPEPENWPPVAVDDYAFTLPSVPISIDVMANDFDLDGDPFTIVSFTQPHGGSLINQRFVDTKSSVRLDPTDDTKLLYNPEPTFIGTDWFTYTIRDNNGNSSTGNVWVDVGQFYIQPQPQPQPQPFPFPPDTSVQLNRPPVAVNDSERTEVNHSLTLDVMSNDYDPDYNRILMVSFTQPSNGTVLMNEDQSLEYTPNDWFSGWDYFSYTITDTFGARDTGFVSIEVYEPESYPPEARDDSAVTSAYQSVTIFVLANDSDPTGDALSIFAVTDPIEGGTVEVLSNNRIRYTPAWGFEGLDSFAYSIGDSNGRYDMASVEVLVKPVFDEIIIEPPPIEPPPISKIVLPPIAAPDAAFYQNSTQSVKINVLANDVDPYGGALTLTGVTQPAHGTVTINPDQTVSYKANSGSREVDNFTYTVKNSKNRSATGQVVVSFDYLQFISIGDIDLPGCEICPPPPPPPSSPSEGPSEGGTDDGQADSGASDPTLTQLTTLVNATTETYTLTSPEVTAAMLSAPVAPVTTPTYPTADTGDRVDLLAETGATTPGSKLDEKPSKKAKKKKLKGLKSNHDTPAPKLKKKGHLKGAGKK